MTEQPGNPTDPTQPDPAMPSDAAAPPPPPAAPMPPAQSSAPAAGASQYDFNQAKSTLQGAHKFDLGIIAAGVVAWLAGFLPFYTASVSVSGFGGASTSFSAYHGFFGWFALWVALAGAGVVAASLFGVKLPVATYQAAVGAFALSLLCLILALFIFPGGGCGGTSGLGGVKCDTGHGFGYWLALLLVLGGLALSVMRMRENTSTTA